MINQQERIENSGNLNIFIERFYSERINEILV